MANSQEKITVYNLADLKNTSDDAIPNYLNSLKFRQSHTLTDVRLALGYTAFVVAGACFLWDYKFGFHQTKYLTTAAVALYSVLNGALTLWIWLVERGTVYVGTAPSGETLRISTSTRKNVPQYDICVEIVPRDKSAKPQKLALSRSFTEWFDAAGHFVAPPFQSMLATAIPCVGQLDAKRVKGVLGASSDAYTPEMLDALDNATVSVTGSTAELAQGAKESARRRKV